MEERKWRTRIYVIHPPTKQLMKSVTYRNADPVAVSRKLGKFDWGKNFYRYGNLHIYLEFNENVYDIWEKEYEDYPIERFLRELRKDPRYKK